MESIPDITPFKRRFAEIDALMAEPDFFQDARRAAQHAREHQHLSRILALHERFGVLVKHFSETETLANDPQTEPELRQLAQEELPTASEELEARRRELLVAMIPPEEADSRNTVVEIRAGAGGDEASLFAADLYRMYCRYAERRGWRIEALGSSLSERSGFKLIAFLIKGEDVYKLLKFESGVHRVQRIPETESSGRIHTSTVTVAVLPEAEEVDVIINPEELEITVSRASGPGGQGVNTTDSAVQVLHKPSGMIVTCADERSQIKNRAKALTVLRSRLLENKLQEENARYAAQRKSQVGSGDRSERIRTYNFPQSRLTEHRIGLTLYNLPQIMEGDLDEILEALQRNHYEVQIEALIKEGPRPTTEKT